MTKKTTGCSSCQIHSTSLHGYSACLHICVPTNCDWVLSTQKTICSQLANNFQSLSPSFYFQYHQVIYLGGLSRANQPNLPFLKSVRMRNEAWWTSPLNNLRASLWTNLQVQKIKEWRLTNKILHSKCEIGIHGRTFDQSVHLSQSCNDCKEPLYLNKEANAWIMRNNSC